MDNFNGLGKLIEITRLIEKYTVSAQELSILFAKIQSINDLEFHLLRWTPVRHTLTLNEYIAILSEGYEDVPSILRLYKEYPNLDVASIVSQFSEDRAETIIENYMTQYRKSHKNEEDVDKMAIELLNQSIGFCKSVNLAEILKDMKISRSSQKDGTKKN